MTFLHNDKEKEAPISQEKKYREGPEKKLPSRIRSLERMHHETTIPYVVHAHAFLSLSSSTIVFPFSGTPLSMVPSLGLL